MASNKSGHPPRLGDTPFGSDYSLQIFLAAYKQEVSYNYQQEFSPALALVQT